MREAPQEANESERGGGAALGETRSGALPPLEGDPSAFRAANAGTGWEDDLFTRLYFDKLYFFFIWINVGCLQLNFTVLRAYKPACAEHVYYLFLLLFLLSIVTNIEASAYFLSTALRDRLIDHNFFSDFSTSLRVIIWQEDAINTVILIEVL